MNIVTCNVCPPIPDRRFDWEAYDDDTYDGPGCPVGTVPSELDSQNTSDEKSDSIQPVPEDGTPTDDDPVTMAIAALKCSVAAGKDIIAVSSFAEVALAYLTGHGGDYTAYREAQGEASAARGQG